MSIKKISKRERDKGENVANQDSSQIHETFVTKQMWKKKTRWMLHMTKFNRWSAKVKGNYFKHG